MLVVALWMFVEYMLINFAYSDRTWILFEGGRSTINNMS